MVQTAMAERAEADLERFGRLTKICDGLFIGGKACAHDVEFIITNKIAGVVNCCGQSIPNALASYGLRYLTLTTSTAPNSPPTAKTVGTVAGPFGLRMNGSDGFDLAALMHAASASYYSAAASHASGIATSQHDKAVGMFDAKGKVMQQIFQFIETIRADGGGILIHSIDGNSRAVCAAVAYLCLRFNWSETKGIEFVCYKRPTARPNRSLLAQLKIAARVLRYVQT
jgi:hypothetical protein